MGAGGLTVRMCMISKQLMDLHKGLVDLLDDQRTPADLMQHSCLLRSLQVAQKHGW